MSIIAHPIPARITRHEQQKVQASLDTAPTYSAHAARAIERIIKVIHGLPKLHSRLALTDIEVYIGKSERTVDALVKRWMFHRADRKKKHLFGLVLFNCSLADAKKLERLGIKVIERLKRRNRLCVGQANVSGGSGGKNPSSNDAVVYMTWCPLGTPTAYRKPGKSDIEQVSAEVAAELNNTVKAAQIERGLSAIKRVNDAHKVHLDCY